MLEAKPGANFEKNLKPRLSRASYPAEVGHEPEVDQRSGRLAPRGVLGGESNDDEEAVADSDGHAEPADQLDGVGTNSREDKESNDRERCSCDGETQQDVGDVRQNVGEPLLSGRLGRRDARGRNSRSE